MQAMGHVPTSRWLIAGSAPPADHRLLSHFHICREPPLSLLASPYTQEPPSRARARTQRTYYFDILTFTHEVVRSYQTAGRTVGPRHGPREGIMNKINLGSWRINKWRARSRIKMVPIVLVEGATRAPTQTQTTDRTTRVTTAKRRNVICIHLDIKFQTRNQIKSTYTYMLVDM